MKSLCRLKNVRVLTQNAFSSVRLMSKAVDVVETSVPTVFTSSDMDPNLELARWGKPAHQLFSATPHYIHPSELNYQLPTCGAPEFAFVGRSNVGKSSLIDLLLGNKKIVKISKEPGCTRSINYFGLSKDGMRGNYMAYFVDLPGYGFAKKSKAEQQQWTDTIHSFVANRDQSILRRVYILVDVRRGLRDQDLDMMITLNTAAIPYQIIMTKADLVGAAELKLTVQTAFQVLTSKHGAACLPFIHTVSSVNRSGIEALKLGIGEVFAERFGTPGKAISDVEENA